MNNVFELLSKAVVESKQKVNIPKLSKEEPEEKEESEKAKREEERGSLPFQSNVYLISSALGIKKKRHSFVRQKLIGLKKKPDARQEYE